MIELSVRSPLSQGVLICQQMLYVLFWDANTAACRQIVPPLSAHSCPLPARSGINLGYFVTISYEGPLEGLGCDVFSLEICQFKHGTGVMQKSSDVCGSDIAYFVSPRET